MKNLPKDGAACGIDGCGPTVRKTHQQEESVETSSAARHELTVVSDVICPWCFVAKKNLERALDLLPNRRDYSIVWRPYELNPGMPKEGMDRWEYRSHKFGSWEHSLALDAQVAEAGQQAGITFRHDLMKRTPNTLNAHRLIWFAQHEGVQDAVVEGLFKAYFTEGRDVGEFEVLADLGAGGRPRPSADGCVSGRPRGRGGGTAGGGHGGVERHQRRSDIHSRRRRTLLWSPQARGNRGAPDRGGCACKVTR